jgi:UPF0271 protein
MRIVLDASAFFSELKFEGELYTSWSVVSELKDISSKIRYDLLKDAGLEVLDPGSAALARAREASTDSGEQESLSRTDIDLLALGFQLDAAIATEDYALQNAARHMGVEIVPLRQKKGSEIRWKYRCTGCGKYYKGPGNCIVCGAPVKRRIK